MKKNLDSIPNLRLIIGDKNLSSWSMRPWLVLKASGLAFIETKIQLDSITTKKEILSYSSVGKVPILIHDKLVVSDSLAICEYIAELAPEKKLWPKLQVERAEARSLVAEMHSGFHSIRDQLSMDIRLRMKINHLTPNTISEIERILKIWTFCLKKYQGQYLMGSFGIVDAFYAPVVMRFLSYGLCIENKLALEYMQQIQKYKYVKSWVKDAKSEKNTEFRFS